MLNWPLTLVRWFSLTSRVHRKPKRDTHEQLCPIFANIPILTNLSTLIKKIILLSSSILVLRWSFGHFTTTSLSTKGVFYPLTILSLLQTKNLLKHYKYIVKFILRTDDWFYAAYINIQSLRDTWPRPLIEKSIFILYDWLNLSNFTIHCDVIKLNITEHCFLLSVKCSAASGVLAWNQLQTSLRDWIEGHKDRPKDIQLACSRCLLWVWKHWFRNVCLTPNHSVKQYTTSVQQVL